MPHRFVHIQSSFPTLLPFLVVPCGPCCLVWFLGVSLALMCIHQKLHMFLLWCYMRLSHRLVGEVPKLHPSRRIEFVVSAHTCLYAGTNSPSPIWSALKGFVWEGLVWGHCRVAICCWILILTPDPCAQVHHLTFNFG